MKAFACIIAVLALSNAFLATGAESRSGGLPQATIDSAQQNLFYLMLEHRLEDAYMRTKRAQLFIASDSPIACHFEFTIGENGHLVEYKMTASSNSERFDKLTALALQAAFPVPFVPPCVLDAKTKTVTVGFTFRADFGEANQALLPTSMAVTPPAAQDSRHP